jgi:hypothetical protein
MDESLTRTIKQLTIESIKISNSLYDVCKKLDELLTKQFDGEWQCFAYKRLLGNFRVTHGNGKFIHFNFALLNFAIFQTNKKKFSKF